jgi:hypothetical protein
MITITPGPKTPSRFNHGPIADYVDVTLEATTIRLLRREKEKGSYYFSSTLPSSREGAEADALANRKGITTAQATGESYRFPVKLPDGSTGTLQLSGLLNQVKTVVTSKDTVIEQLQAKLAAVTRFSAMLGKGISRDEAVLTLVSENVPLAIVAEVTGMSEQAIGELAGDVSDDGQVAV